jgi:hypothetical protein
MELFGEIGKLFRKEEVPVTETRKVMQDVLLFDPFDPQNLELNPLLVPDYASSLPPKLQSLVRRFQTKSQYDPNNWNEKNYDLVTDAIIDADAQLCKLLPTDSASEHRYQVLRNFVTRDKDRKKNAENMSEAHKYFIRGIGKYVEPEWEELNPIFGEALSYTPIDMKHNT